MRSRSRRLPLLAFLACFLFGLALPAGAAEVDSSDIVIITEDDVFDGDLYVAANRVLVRGTIDGDLFAVAAQDVRIEGLVTGSVTALAAEVVVTGSIGQSLRATSPSLEISGLIGEDVVVASGSLSILDGAVVEGDVVVWGWSATSTGLIEGDLEGTIRQLTIGGTVGGVGVTVRRIEAREGLVVNGDLTYRSDSEIVGLDPAGVDGAVVQQSPVSPNIRIRALGLATRIVVAILLSAVALLVASAWPERTERAVTGLASSPLRYIPRGLAVVLSPLLIVGIGVAVLALAPVSAALPLVAALIPVLFATLGIVLVLGFIAGIPAVAWLGSRIKRNSTIAGAVGIGSLVVAALWLVPLIGWVVALVVLVTGLGGWISTLEREPAAEVPVGEVTTP